MKLVKNVGGIDQIMRFSFSVPMIYLGFFSNKIILDNLAGILLGCFGLIVFLSAVFRSCPLYMLIGFSSNDDKNK